jgi:hypothetical protein
MFPYMVTPEMIRAIQEHEAQVAALTPEEASWLRAEEHDRQARVQTDARTRERFHEEMELLLHRDIEELGCPTT